MSKKRRVFSAEFKSKVVLEVLVFYPKKSRQDLVFLIFLGSVQNSVSDR